MFPVSIELAERDDGVCILTCCDYYIKIKNFSFRNTDFLPDYSLFCFFSILDQIKKESIMSLTTIKLKPENI
jgi:hypothetical protein